MARYSASIDLEEHMPRDGSIQPPEPFHGVSPAPAGFTSLGDAANVALDLVIDAMETRNAAQVAHDAKHARLEAEAEDMLATAKAVADAAPVGSDMPDFQQRRARIWAVEQSIRQALADTLQGDRFTDAEITGAAEVVIDFPTAWVAYDPISFGTPRALNAYKAALRELADPSLTVKRLEQLGRFRFDAACKHLDDAKERVGRVIAREGVEREQAKASFEAAMTCATEAFAAGAALMASADGFRAKIAEAA